MRKELLMAVALTGVLPATAGNGVAKSGKSDTDSLNTLLLQDVEVVATRASQHSPMAFQNINYKQLKGVNYGKDLPYVLSLSPSVTMTSDAGNGIGYTSLRIRGTDPGRINITVNGIPQNDAESSQLYWVNMGDFASSLQSVQVQRGVGTSTNGAAAFGATVNMKTENIGTEPYFSLDASGGSYYSHKETLRFGTGLLGGHWGIQGRLSNIGSKGYVRRASTKLNSYFLQAGYFSDHTMLKFVTFNGNEETYHAWNYTSKYEQSLYGRRYNSCGEYRDDDGNVHYYKNQTDNYHQQNYQLILSQQLTNMLNLHAALHYTKGQGYYEEYKQNAKYPGYGLSTTSFKSDLIRQKKMDNDFYGAIADITYDNRSGLKATVGGGWNKYDGDHFGRVIWAKEPQQELLPDHEYYRNNAKKTDGNVYGKANWNFYKGMSAFLDLQYRHVMYKMQDPHEEWGYNKDGAYIFKDNFDFFNPKVGFNWQITRNHRAYVSYAISHREPTRTNYKDSITNGVSYPKAERLNDLELGYVFESQKFTASANFYYMNYHNQFVLTGELDDAGYNITRNVEKSYRMGVELQAAWKPVDWFRWDANATFSRNRVKDMMVTLNDYTTTVNIGDKPLSFSPDVIFNNILTFTYKGFEAKVVERYVGEQYLTNTGMKTMSCVDDQNKPTEETLMLNDHWTTDLAFNYTFSLRKWGLKSCTVGVDLYNLFSKKYDNNGWASPQFTYDSNKKVIAVNEWGTRDYQACGFAPSAPFNAMAHVSLNF